MRVSSFLFEEVIDGKAVKVEDVANFSGGNLLGLVGFKDKGFENALGKVIEVGLELVDVFVGNLDGDLHGMFWGVFF